MTARTFGSGATAAAMSAYLAYITLLELGAGMERSRSMPAVDGG